MLLIPFTELKTKGMKKSQLPSDCGNYPDDDIADDPAGKQQYGMAVLIGLTIVVVVIMLIRAAFIYFKNY
jgi:hypothetical protein